MNLSNEQIEEIRDILSEHFKDEEIDFYSVDSETLLEYYKDSELDYHYNIIEE